MADSSKSIIASIPFTEYEIGIIVFNSSDHRLKHFRYALAEWVGTGEHKIICLYEDFKDAREVLIKSAQIREQLEKLEV